MSKRKMPPLLTICILFAIVCIVVIARGKLTTNEEKSIPALTNDIVLLENDELSTSERVVITSLLSGVELIDSQQDVKDNNYRMYVNYLKEYLSSSGVDLSTTNANKVVDDIKGINAIISLEKESNFMKMSLDGRGVAIHIFEKVYQLCGLKLVYNMQGTIIRISDVLGNFIYVKDIPVTRAGFQFNALVMTIVVLAALYSLCIMIAKKNQLFMKEEVYNTKQSILDM